MENKPMESTDIELIVDEDIYELPMIDYQLVVIDILNKALKDNGVEDLSIRKSIIAQFEGAHGALLDQGWIKGEGGKYYPEVFFTKRQFSEDDGLMEIDSILIPEYASNFHEYGNGAFTYYFDESDEKLTEIEYSCGA